MDNTTPSPFQNTDTNDLPKNVVPFQQGANTSPLASTNAIEPPRSSSNDFSEPLQGYREVPMTQAQPANVKVDFSGIQRINQERENITPAEPAQSNTLLSTPSQQAPILPQVQTNTVAAQELGLNTSIMQESKVIDDSDNYKLVMYGALALFLVTLGVVGYLVYKLVS